jgi:hypothetical protein
VPLRQRTLLLAKAGLPDFMVFPLEWEIFITFSYDDSAIRDHFNINRILYLSDVAPCNPVDINRRLGRTYSVFRVKIKLSEQAANTAPCLLPFVPEDGGTVFLRNVTKFLPDVHAISKMKVRK